MTSSQANSKILPKIGIFSNSEQISNVKKASSAWYVFPSKLRGTPHVATTWGVSWRCQWPEYIKKGVATLVQMDSCCRDAELLVLWTVFRYLIILYHHSFGTNDKKIKIHTHLDISFEAPFWVHLVVLVLILWHRNTVMNLSLGALHLSPLHTSWLRQWRCCRWNQGVYP